MKTNDRSFKVLVGADGSPHARRALAFAAARAAARGGTVVAVAVVPPLRASPRPGEIAVVEALNLRARTALREWENRLRGRGVRVVTRVEESLRPAEALLRAANRERVAAVVVGARGLSPLKSFFLGSVSQRVSRAAKRPVLVVRRDMPPRGLRVLVAADGSSPSRRAAAFLSRWGLPRGSTVTAVHVVSDPLAFWSPEAGGYPGVVFPAPSMVRIRAEGRRRLRRVLAELRRDFPRVRGILAEGSPAAELLAAARKTRAHLIVMGARGLSGLDRFVLGSVSQRVLSHAAASVLMAR